MSPSRRVPRCPLAALIVVLAAGSIAACRPPQPTKPASHGLAAGPVIGVPDLSGSEQCGPFSPTSLMLCVDQARIEADVRELTRVRTPDPGAHQAVRSWGAARLRQLGFDVELHDYGSGVNVLGRRRGLTKPLDRVVLGAHYDQRPGCRGADDNASGVAAVLEAARVLAAARFEQSLVIALWDEGERDQKGSRSFAERALARETTIRAVYSLEAVGYASNEPESQRVPERFEEVFPDESLKLVESDFRGDFATVVVDGASEQLAEALEPHAKRLTLPLHRLFITERMKVKLDALHRSDHVGFWEARFPALLLTDTGDYRNPHFHCKQSDDHPDTLDYVFAGRMTALAVAGIAELLRLR